ncbi:MAG: hypothetical protein Tsb005_12960 [Gammaproteobacteria bacterium]
MLTKTDENLTINTILYVEDDEAEAYFFTRRMQRYGYQISIAHNVAEAITIFEPQIHGIVVTDWNLPDGKAPAVISGIRAKKADIPIVAMSSCFKEEFLEEAEKLHVDKCITKSLQCDYLNILATFIDNLKYVTTRN